MRSLTSRFEMTKILDPAIKSRDDGLFLIYVTTELGGRYRFTIFLAQAISVEAIPSRLQLESGLGSRLESGLESVLADKIIGLIARNEIGKSGIAAALGHKTISSGLYKQINRLLVLNFIEMTLPDKPNSRLQKYRLTKKGRKLIRMQENK